MKALSIWQPWASLIAVGAKSIETRHWPAPNWVVGQRIAVHASKRGTEMWLCLREPFKTYLPEPLEVPLGGIVAIATIDRCSEMTEDGIAVLEQSRPHELAFGHYEPGRFAWVLREVHALPVPVPLTGRQGVFDVYAHEDRSVCPNPSRCDRDHVQATPADLGARS